MIESRNHNSPILNLSLFCIFFFMICFLSLIVEETFIEDTKLLDIHLVTSIKLQYGFVEIHLHVSWICASFHVNICILSHGHLHLTCVIAFLYMSHHKLIIIIKNIILTSFTAGSEFFICFSFFFFFFIFF